MATTTNYAWDTPDDTDLVKDGAAAIRTLGSSIDTTTKALNPQTTTGALAYRSATANVNTALPIGSTGNVLTVAGGVPSWAAPAAGGANWSLLNAGGTALTGAATVTVSGISGMDKIMILISGASSVNANAQISVRLNADTGSNYTMHGPVLIARTLYQAGNLDRTSTTTTRIVVSDLSDNAASVVSGYVLLSGCNSSGVKVFNSVGAADTGGGTGQAGYLLGGFYNSASTISSISIFSTSGNLDAGTVFVYTSA